MKYLLLVLLMLYGTNILADIELQMPIISAEESKFYNEILALRGKNPQEALQKLATLPSTSSAAFAYLEAAILLDLKQEDKATLSLQKALEKLPTFYQARLILSQIFLSQKKYNLALVELLEVVKLGRGDANIWKQISFCHLELKNYDNAEMAIKQAKLFSINDFSLDNALLNIYYRQESYTKAEELAAQMLNQQNEDKNIWSIYIQALLANKKFKEARLTLDLKIRLFPHDNNDLKLLADLFFNERLYLKAASTYQKVEGELKGKATIQAAQAYFHLGKFKEVLILLKNSENLSPSEKEQFYICQGQCYLKLSDSNAAEKSFNESLKYNSNNSLALFSLAEIFENNKRYNESLEYYERAAKNQFYYVSAKLRRARIYLLLQQNQQALTEVEEVKKVDNSTSTNQYYEYIKAKLTP